MKETEVNDSNELNKTPFSFEFLVFDIVLVLLAVFFREFYIPDGASFLGILSGANPIWIFIAAIVVPQFVYILLLGVVPVRILMMFTPGFKWYGIAAGAVSCGVYIIMAFRYIGLLHGISL
ncbi:MAG: hypothetical protein A2Y33_07595 [Spirochaetes bacterium GWF1_51_8]|nr:MAG: hypothetical protein A2Y33_07595 [Spirochaetes bacterium GWF1_51_8]